MIGRLVSQILGYLAIGVFLSLLWVVMGDGETEQLKDFVRSPGTTLDTDYWPIYWWLIGGLLVAFSVARTLGRLLRPSTWSRQLRRRRELEAQGVPRTEAMLTAADERQHRSRRPWRRGTQFLAVVFTDISGSTALNEELGDDVFADVVNQHRALVRDTTRRFGGSEVATQGDGFFMRFDDDTAAVGCALSIQQRLRARRRDEPLTPEVRIGIHSGEAVHGHDDVLGQVVNIGARVLDVAGPGEIVVTEPVLDRADITVPVDDRGLVDLKGFSHRRHVAALCWQEADDAGV